MKPTPTLNAFNMTPQPGFAIGVRPRPLESKPRPSDGIFLLRTDLRPGPDAKAGAVIRAGTCVLMTGISGAIKGPDGVLFILDYDNVLAQIPAHEAENISAPVRAEVFGAPEEFDEEALRAMVDRLMPTSPLTPPTDEQNAQAEAKAQQVREKHEEMKALDAQATTPEPAPPRQPRAVEPKRTPGATRRDDPRNVEST